MHHPGPPRFVTVGETVTLAPRNPDPEREYAWRITTAPESSTATLGGDAVERLRPDVPGTYRVELRTGDLRHRLTVRAFPDPHTETEIRVDNTAFECDDDIEYVTVIGRDNGYVLGTDYARHEDGAYVIERSLPPGEHHYGFVPNGDITETVWEIADVPGPSRPRLSLRGSVEGDEVVIEGECRSPTDDDSPTVEFYVDDRDDVDDDAIEVSDTRMRIDRNRIDDPVRVHGVAVGRRHSVPDAVRVDPAGDGGAVEATTRAPDWIRDAVVYQIYVRSFTAGTTTFADLESKVEYLDDLGVDCVWLTPILEHDGDEHGYNVTNFFETAADLGSRSEYESFVEACHERGIRVLFDLVLNHASQSHPRYDPDASDERGQRFFARDGTDPRYAFSWEKVVEFDYDNPEVRSFLRSVVDEWAPIVDGFRCDVAWGVPHDFWKELREQVKAIDDQFLLVDEAIPYEERFHDREFDVHFDTALFRYLRDVAAGERSPDELLEAIRHRSETGFPPHATFLQYIENHDAGRYLEHACIDAQKAAAAATFTLPGVPVIYAGQELGVDHRRGDLPWDDYDDSLREFYRDLIELRRSVEPLREGEIDEIPYDSGSDEVVCFLRETETERVLVALHFGEGTATVDVPATVEPTPLGSFRSTARDTDAGVTVEVDTCAVFPVSREADVVRPAGPS